MPTKNTTKALPVTDEEVEALPTETTYSAKDLASECGTDPKSFRRWLRAQTTDRANKGGRWVFTAESKAAFIEAYKARGSKGTEAKLPAADAEG